MSKEKSTEVALAAQTAVALAAVPDFMSDEDFGNTGFEGADVDSFAIPFIQVLQKMSPIVDSDDPKYVEGAKAGMFFNTVTNGLFDGKEGIDFIPCYYKRSFIQWGGREGENKGFKGEFTPEQIEKMVADGTIVAKDGKLFLPLADGSVNEKKSDRYEDTRSHFIVFLDLKSGEYGRAILSLSSTQIKASKSLLTSLQQKKVDTPSGKRTPPMYANIVHATTVGQSNDKGSWSGIRFDLTGIINDANLFAEAKQFYKDVVGGTVAVDYSKAERSDADVGSKPADAEEF